MSKLFEHKITQGPQKGRWLVGFENTGLGSLMRDQKGKAYYIPTEWLNKTSGRNRELFGPLSEIIEEQAIELGFEERNLKHWPHKLTAKMNLLAFIDKNVGSGITPNELNQTLLIVVDQKESS